MYTPSPVNGQDMRTKQTFTHTLLCNLDYGIAVKAQIKLGGGKYSMGGGGGGAGSWSPEIKSFFN